MIGLGTWEFSVDTMFYKGEASIKIFDNDGEYGFTLVLPNHDQDVPEFEVSNIEVNDNTLTADITADLLKGKIIPISITFDGDRANGFAKIPFLGKLKLKDGKRVGD